LTDFQALGLEEMETKKKEAIMNAKDLKLFKMKLLDRDMSLQQFYFKHIAVLDISFSRFSNQYYGTIKMKEPITEAIKKFMEE